MLFDYLKNGLRIFKRNIFQNIALCIKLEAPAFGVVFMFVFNVAAEKAVPESEITFNKERGVGIIYDIFFKI
jgi:hypothetical protein